MKKALLLLTLCIPLLSGSGNVVYVCTGKYAKAYHKTSTCKGIKSCKADIKQITMDQAIHDGKKACKLCY